MPAPEQILAGLSEIANNWTRLAAAWHLYYGVLTLWVLGARPSRSASGIILSVPLLSVSALAWVYGNPFSGVILAIAAIVLFTIAVRLPGGRTEVSSRWQLALGALMLVFGWVYPHFLKSETPWSYFYAAALGLLPCPTLSASIGTALMADGLGSRPYMLVLGMVGAFYGLFGAVRLGVLIDIVLLFGAMAIVVAALRGRPGPHDTV